MCLKFCYHPQLHMLKYFQLDSSMTSYPYSLSNSYANGNCNCAECNILTTFKTSLWRTIHLTDLKFRQQHLPLSTRLMSFLSAPFEEIEQLTPHPFMSLLWTGHMWDKTFIHLVWVPCSEKAEQPLQQVQTANEDNFEQWWLDGISLNS